MSQLVIQERATKCIMVLPFDTEIPYTKDAVLVPLA